MRPNSTDQVAAVLERVADDREMVIMMFVGMNRSPGALEAPWNWIANITLVCLSPLVLLPDRGEDVHGCA
jgi:hypothetical protein